MKKDIKELLHTYPAYRKMIPFFKKNKIAVGSVLGIAVCALLIFAFAGTKTVETEISSKPTSLVEYQKDEQVNSTNFSKLYEGMNVEDINFLEKK